MEVTATDGDLTGLTGQIVDTENGPILVQAVTEKEGGGEGTTLDMREKRFEKTEKKPAEKKVKKTERKKPTVRRGNYSQYTPELRARIQDIERVASAWSDLAGVEFDEEAECGRPRVLASEGV